MKKANSLDLSNNNIAKLPKTFSTLVNITKLDLSQNLLKELPENFGDLVKLKHLDLYQNKLEYLPVSFGNLKALRWLDLKDNFLVPALAKVAGPCLESKQCQDCARDVVKFFSRMQEKLEIEKEMKEKSKKKQQELAIQKPKEDKKAKKKDKSQTNNVHKNSNEKASRKDNKNKKSKQSNSKKSKMSKFTSFLVLFLISLASLFVLTSLKTKNAYLELLETTVTQYYYLGVAALPDNLKLYGEQFAGIVHNTHELTGKYSTYALSEISHFVQTNKTLHAVLEYINSVASSS